jgi:hypothetical protein
MPPVTRTPLAVREGDDEDVIGFDGVEHGVRKNTRSTNTHVLLHYAPTVGRRDDLSDGTANFPCKALAENAPTIFIELNGFLELQKCFGMELVPHFASKRSMRR